jgi:hypothetical protein
VVDVVALQWKALYDRTEDKAFSLKVSQAIQLGTGQLRFCKRSSSCTCGHFYGAYCFWA